MRLLTPRVPLKEKMFFVEHLAVMLKAAIPLDRALSTLAEQTAHKSFRRILQTILEAVKRGETLSSGLAQFESVFGGFFVSMIAAGEYSGKLEDGLRRLYMQMKKDYELRSKVISALTYPIFVVIAMIGIGGTIMLFVVPKLIPLFEGFGAQLPLATRILIALSRFLSTYALFVALAMIAGGIALIKLLRGPWRHSWHGLLLRTPIISGLIKRIHIARFSRTLSTLLSTDILVVDALKITAKILGNEHYKIAILKMAEQVTTGIPIATAIKEYPTLFPPTLHTMVQVGEESGTLVDLLGEVAEFYEESVDDTTKSISSIIEPALIILLGAAVGGIALAILMPMYTLLDQV